MENLNDRSNYNISGCVYWLGYWVETIQMIKEIRLFFEPKLGTCVNHSKMFKHYADSYLEGFPIQFAGSISMDSLQKVEYNMEPVYQYIMRDASISCNNYLIEYLTRNPLHGYYIHMYHKYPNENLIKISNVFT